jgi:hypothetical protein
MPSTPRGPVAIPLSRDAVIDRYFLEHRAKLLDLAAFLDRVDRAVPADGAAEATVREGMREDFRMASLRAAIAVLLDGSPQRSRRILELLSDPTSEPIGRAPAKGASGAWPGFGGDPQERGR